MPTINNIEALLAFNHSIEQRAVDAEQEGKEPFPMIVMVEYNGNDKKEPGTTNTTTE